VVNGSPSCPRCGYDLSGDVASWNGDESYLCPMEGRCSECGLEFEWADIFNPFRRRVAGFIEHEERGLYWAAWRTWLLAMRPKRFWTVVKIEFEPRVGRMLLWLVMLVMSLWVIGPLICNAVELWLQLTTPLPGNPFSALQPWVQWLITQEYMPTGPPRYVLDIRSTPGFVLGPLAASFIVPLVLLCLPVTRRLAKVRVAHVARAAVYGLAWLMPMLLFKSIEQIGQAITWIAWIRMGGRVAGRPPMPVELYNEAYRFVRHYWILWLLFVLAWVGAWWWFALGTGWRLREYGTVMRALVITGVLAAAVAILLSDDGYRVFM
jgi:hypothetical protein